MQRPIGPSGRNWGGLFPGRGRAIAACAAMLRLLATADLVGAEAPTAGGGLLADTWAATDALGRTLPGDDECGPLRPGKTVALFYWTWHIPTNGGARGPFDNTRIAARALVEGVPAEWPVQRANHFWGEPELGYYLSTDPFVLRRHASMLADAGVDVIVFDTSNPPWTWKEAYMALGREFTAMREEGNQTPGIAFLCPFGDPTVVVKKVHEELYGPRLYGDLWFQWRGRPLILANPKYFRSLPEILDFFTFRTPIPGYWTRPGGPGQWPWLQVHPQHGFPDETGGTEIVAVGVAQNAIVGARGPAPMSHRQGAMGRSWHGGARDPDPDATDYGPNFQEQWDRAIALDPEAVFVTGWNEWTAIRLPTFGPYNEREHPYHRRGLFIDQYSREYSRDCEPMKGGHTDCYYYQLVANIRRFKGVRPRPQPGGPSAIRIDGRFEDWAEVVPEYRDTVGDTLHRDHPGYGERVYTNDTGRNDIVRCKVAYDDRHVFFLAESRAALTPPSGRNWMLLLVDVDQDHDTGWEGYDFLVNETRPARGGTASITRLGVASEWKGVGSAPLAISGNRIELSVAREALGLVADGVPGFDFHWADNIQRLAVEEFGVNGDSAPNRRSNFRFGPDPAEDARPVLGYFGNRPPDADPALLAPDELLDLADVSWIWHPETPDAQEEAPVGTVRFRRELTVSEDVGKSPAFVVAAVDNTGSLSLNGDAIGTVSGWTPPAAFPVKLKPGANLVEVVVDNVGEAPNPAGLALQVGVRHADGSVAVLTHTGDGEWQAAAEDGDDWREAVRLAPVGDPPWGPVR